MRFAVKSVVLLLGLLMWAALAPAQTPVEESVHNLSSTGPGTIKAGSDVGVCIFCHVPHKSVGNGTPIWNKQLPADAGYQTYTSSTYKQSNNPVSQRSKLCLSCHDGTIALGQTYATGDLGVSNPMPDSANLTQDLRRDHPISFTLPATDDGEIKPWITTAPLTSPDPAVKLYENKVECLTCHDPHVPDKDTVAGKFLVRSNKFSAVCTTCHDTTRGELANYNTGQHAQATNAVAGTAGLSYASVQENGCLACHNSHSAAGTGPRLLRGVEENTCATCHSAAANLTPVGTDVISVLNNATYKHPVLSVQDAHDPAETLPVNTTRHSECQDCHNPHAARNNSTPSLAPGVQQALLGTNGVSITDGSTLKPAANEYEVCFKCHGGSTNKPQRAGYDADFGRTAWRQSMISPGVTDPYNAAQEFKSSIARHNVALTRSGASVPSLRPTIVDLNGNPTARSLASGNIYCADCHNSELARSDGGTGISGPHGSNWPHILERRYETNVPGATPGAPVTTVGYSSGISGSYALCDKCHNVDAQIMNGPDTAFGGLHKNHVNNGMACSSCHNSHGIQGSDATHHGNLIDPDLSIAAAPGVTAPAADRADPYINTASRTCALTCHGVTHSITPGFCAVADPTCVNGRY